VKTSQLVIFITTSTTSRNCNSAKTTTKYVQIDFSFLLEQI